MRSGGEKGTVDHEGEVVGVGGFGGGSGGDDANSLGKGRRERWLWRLKEGDDVEFLSF